MPACVVPGCELYELALSIGIPFHRFPNDPDIRRQWLVKIRNQALPVNSSHEKLKNKRVCGKHFVPSDYERDLQHELTGSKRKNILKSNAVPSIFPFVLEADLNKPTRSAFEKREELRRQAERRQPSFAFGSEQQQQQQASGSGSISSTSVTVRPGERTPTKGHDIATDVSDTPGSWTLSSPFKLSSPIQSSPYKPSSSEEQTTTTTEAEASTESENETCPQTKQVIVSENMLYELFKRCQTCGEGIISKQSSHVGAKLTISWECVKGHEGHWGSCGDIRGMPDINLQLASSIVLSGNTFQSFKNLAEVLKLYLFSKSTFNNIQNTYILPVIDQTYQRQYFRNMALLLGKTLDGESVSLLGDGRSDSPGFSAKYTTYSVMEESTEKIVEMQLVQVTETTSSVAMEKEGFVRSMENVLGHGVKVETFTTDRSPSIRKAMREQYKDINHQFDCWHICKGLKKKCLARGRKKGQDILLKWTKSITNHLWYACSTCGGDAVKLKKIWHSILQHVTGVHRWEDEDGTEHSCEHEPLSEEDQASRMWLDPKSTAFRDLRSIVMDPRLNKDLEQLTLFKHTSGLESYHSTMLKFAPKRLHFHYAAMNGRMQLAVIDHNYNTGREVATTQAGKAKYRYVSTKMKGGEWTVKNVRQEKSHGYATEMMVQVTERRRNPSITYMDKESFVALPKMPRNIAKERRPPVEELLAKKAKH